MNFFIKSAPKKTVLSLVGGFAFIISVYHGKVLFSINKDALTFIYKARPKNYLLYYTVLSIGIELFIPFDMSI